MTTTQTIDRLLVSRELLELCWLTLVDNSSYADDVRALLDAPCPFTGYPPVPEDRKLPAAPPHGETVECTHEWTDDGGHLLVCTACGAHADHDPGWKDMASAPTDGTMLRLLVEFEEHPTEDADQAVTIGANNFDNNGEDNWQFAGWCWSHDHFTEGKGTPVGWLPMLDEPKVRAAIQTVEAR